MFWFRHVKPIDNAIGWIGTGLIGLAYILVSLEILPSHHILYPVLNGLGALGIMYISFKNRTYQPAVLNTFWALVALIAFIRLFFT